MTPEQMRELADALDAGVFRSEGIWPEDAQDVENAMAALRSAADQLTNMQRAYRELEDQRDRYVRRYSQQSDELRTAADQLEAVQRVADSHRSDAETAACIVPVRLDAILTAGTAPQEPQAPQYPGEPWVSLAKRVAPQESDATYSGTLREALLECAAVFPGDPLGPVMHCRKRKGHSGEHNADGMRWLR